MKFSNRQIFIGVGLSVLLAIVSSGCGVGLPTHEEDTLARIKEVSKGNIDFVSGPHKDTILGAVTDNQFVENLKELALNGDVSGYNRLFEKLRNLKRVAFLSSKNTEAGVAAIPSTVTSLGLDQTDLSYHASSDVPVKEFYQEDLVEERFEVITRCESLRKLYISPWDKRLSAKAIEIFAKMKSLEVISIEWFYAPDEDVAALKSGLQAALPNCRIIVDNRP